MTLKTRNAKPNKSQWQRYFFYRKESLRTTWKLRLSVLLFGILIVSLTRGFWTVKIAQTLVCKEQSPHSDALLLENFDPDYLVFERAAALQKAGIAARIFEGEGRIHRYNRTDGLSVICLQPRPVV